ncbi:helix-turn-helix domain-containing protein [Clostridium cellulovorans]|nr:helix-turn-helix domain-containing protein [Clostridium cellulovorans]
MSRLHLDTIIRWEQGVFPKPENVKLLGEMFSIPIVYFDEYYSIYYSSYQDRIREWKDRNRYSYSMAEGILGVSHSGFARLLSGKIRLSYDMYMKLKTLNVF